MNAQTERELLQMRNIGIAFSGVRILADVRLDVAAGEVHVLAGENGAGKTTLMRILSGVYTDYAGEILLGGQPVRFRSPRDAADRGISMIHQELSLVPTLNATDNVFLGRECTSFCGWLDRTGAEVRVKEILRKLDVEVDLRRPVEDFPVSVRQMIEVAKALAFDARVIVMDEPTSALSKPEVDRLFGAIAELKARGCGVIYITHRMEEIYRLADRITVLRDGAHIGTARASELPAEELVRRMVGRAMERQFPAREPRPGRKALSVQSLRVSDPAGRGGWAVRDVSFELAEGEVLGLAGLEGAGNHEVLHAIFNGGRHVQGEVRLQGRVLRRRRPGRSIAAGLALLTNDRKGSGLVPGLSVARNATLASLRRFSPRLWMRRRAETAAALRQRDAMRIHCASVEQPVDELSGGNQQKVALAKWIETQPRVLMLDEPTRGVDVGAKKDIYDLINAWTREGIAVLLITSEMPELLALSDRIVVMHRGRVTATFKRAEATQERVLAAAMGGAVENDECR